MESIPHRLKYFRQSQKWSQEDAAEYFGASVGAISLWESGKRKMNGPALRLLETYEHCSGVRENKAVEKRFSKINTSPITRFLHLS